jgi:hypothetical protein
VNGENKGTYTVSGVVVHGGIAKYKLSDALKVPVQVNGEQEVEESMLKPVGE